jgi:hypothetical protein
MMAASAWLVCRSTRANTSIWVKHRVTDVYKLTWDYKSNWVNTGSQKYVD